MTKKIHRLKKNKNKSSGTGALFFHLISWMIFAWMMLLAITMVATLYYSLNTFQEKSEDTLRSTAVTLSGSRMVQRMLDDGVCSVELMQYLDDLVAESSDLSVVTICNARSIRIYHVRHENIGQRFVGGDEQRALAGESYFSDAVGTMGMQHRFLTPVKDHAGQVVGFVMTGATMDEVKKLRGDIINTYVRLMIALTLVSLGVSALISLLVRQTLHGLTADELVHGYLAQEDMLSNLTNGVIAVDRNGNIQLANRAAQEMLGQQAEDMQGESLDTIIRENSGLSLLHFNKENTPTSRPNILAQTVPLYRNEKPSGSIVILTDRSEAMRAAEQLNGTRHIVTALRANSHEFMNKLQVISGLLQMGRSEDALDYMNTISTIHTKSIAPILENIQNANLAALLLGKLDNMNELDIQLNLMSNSFIPPHSAFLSTVDLVTVLGNLLENAIEAVNARCDDEPRSIELQITEDEQGLLLMISDTGVGIAPEQIEQIYDLGFSTKATEGRGTGMHLVKEIINRHGGVIEVDSEPDVGTTFTIIFKERRQRI